MTSAGGLVALNGSGGLSNTILAKNLGINADFYGRGGALNSLIGITDERSGFIDGVNGNIVGSVKTPVDPQIGQLAENGGALATHALLPGSRAIDTGNNALSIDRHGDPLLIDQRGYDRIVNSTVDIGSYEFNSMPAIMHSTIKGRVTNSSGRGHLGARVTLRNENGVIQTVGTNVFGYFRFVNVPGKLIYTIECAEKRKTFTPQKVLVEETVETINFVSN